MNDIQIQWRLSAKMHVSRIVKASLLSITSFSPLIIQSNLSSHHKGQKEEGKRKISNTHIVIGAMVRFELNRNATNNAIIAIEPTATGCNIDDLW